MANDYRFSANRLNGTLADTGVQFRQSSIWFLYAKYASQGYTQSKTHLLGEERAEFGHQPLVYICSLYFSVTTANVW